MSQIGFINNSTLQNLTSSNGITISGNTVSLDSAQFHSLATGVQIKGNNTNTPPPIGYIGEQIISVATVSSASSIVDNITSIVLTPGIWDISAIYGMACTGSIAGANIGISLNSASFSGVTFGDNGIQAVTTGASQSLSVPSYRLMVNVNTTLFLIHLTSYTGTCTMTGRLSATRVG